MSDTPLTDEDLAVIRTRLADLIAFNGTHETHRIYRKDVTALLAEVERLRDENQRFYITFGLLMNDPATLDLLAKHPKPGST